MSHHLPLGLRVKKLLRLCCPFLAGAGVVPPEGLRGPELLEADVGLVGALGAGIADADADVDLASAGLFGASFLVAPLVRFEPATTGVSDSSEE